MRLLLSLILLSTSHTALSADEVYRWVDKEGVVHYGGQPPSKDAKPATLPTLQTYRPDAKPLAQIAEPPQPAASSTITEVRVLAPVQDEIFRDPAGVVNVAVAVLPAMPEGAGVIFYLDGAAKNAKPSASTSTSFTSIERGEHTVAAAVVDASGKELKRSAAVTFHAKPPGLRN